MKITRERRLRIKQRTKALMRIYGYAESTARKKAGKIERLLATLETDPIWVRFYDSSGRSIKTRATLVGYDKLHNQSTRNKFIMFYDEPAKKNAETGKQGNLEF